MPATHDNALPFAPESAEDSILQQPIAAATSSWLQSGWRYVRARVTVLAVSLILLGAVFFFIYGKIARTIWIPEYRATGQIIHDWPDATAAQFFIDELRVNSRLAVPHKVPGPASAVIHPRSVKVINNKLVPVGFLGLPILYGLLGKIVGVAGVLWLTPAFAVLGVGAFYILLKRIFGRATAWLSAVMLFSLPAYWYFSSLAFLPNILFADLLIIGLALFTNRARRASRILGIFFGALIIGLALTVRTAETPWVLVMLAIMLIMYPRRVGVYMAALGLGLGLAFTPIFAINYKLYGHILASGYLRISNVDLAGSLLARLPTELQVGQVSPGLAFLKLIFLPFGWHPRVLLTSVYLYIIQPLGIYLVLIISGWVAWFIGKKRLRAQWAYFWCATISSAWLLFYYGNWQLADKDILLYNGIGSSYTRYFLPIFIFLLPGAALALTYLIAEATRLGKVWRTMAIVVAVALLSGWSYGNYQAVYLAPRDGLRVGAAHLREYYARYGAVEKLIESAAILITDRTDKIFFSKYDVAVLLADNSIFNYLRAVISSRPVYYFTTMSDLRIRELNRIKLLPIKLKLSDPQIVDSEYRLFRLVQI